jgi:hypothetical protein
MKKIYALTLSLAVVLSACSKNEDGSTTVTIPPIPALPSVNDVTHAASKMTNLGNINQTTQEMQQTMESLKSLTPVSNDQLKSLMPESFNSIQRSSFEISKKLGASTLNCEFKENNVSYTISIYDGAGEVGSGIAALKMLGINLNAESENEKGYKKNITLGNARGTEIQTGKDTGNIKNELKLLVGNRFFMEVSATGTDMESIKTGIKKAKLVEKLEALK